MESEPNVDRHEGNWYVLIFGLAAPDSPLSLASGLTLSPLTSRLSVFDLASAGAAGFREWALLEPAANQCACEIESAKDSDVRPGYDTLNRAWLASSLLVLRGFSRHLAVACSSYSWSHIAGHQKRNSPVFREQLAAEGIDAAVFNPKGALRRFKGGVLDFHVQLMVDQYARTDAPSIQDAEWIGANFDHFNRLASESDAFRLALEAAIDWRFSKNSRIAIGRIWSGIEAVFGVTSELVFRVSLLAASLLEARGSARLARFRAVKKLYGIRSKAVHGDVLSDQQLVLGVDESFQLLRELLLLSIERGHVLGEDDFDQAVFG